MKPYHVNSGNKSMRISRCACCASKFSEHRGGLKAGKKRARQFSKRLINSEM